MEEKDSDILNKHGLKPCPFCGESKYVEVIREGTARMSCQVQCGECGCFLESNEIGSGDTWNRRV